MAINPLTGKEEENFVTPGGTVVPLNEPIKAIESTIPDPTVATKDNPLVNRGIINLTGEQQVQGQELIAPTTDDIGEATDIRTTKIGEVLSDEEKRTLIDKERDRIRNIEGISFEERNKQFRKLNEDIQSGVFFGGETQLEMERKRAEADKRRIEQQAGEAITSAEELFKQQLEQETTRIKEQGQRVMDTTQRLNSLRGAGRSSANEAAIMEQQTKINDLISAAERDSNLKLQKRKLEIEGAEAEAIAAINEQIASNESVLNQRIAEAKIRQQELDAAIGADAATSMNNALGLLEAGGVDPSGIDLKVTETSGSNYFLKPDGSVWINPKTQAPEVFKRNEFNQEVKVSQFKDGNDNTYVYANGQLDRIITNDGKILTGEQLDTVEVPAQVKEDKSLQENRQLEGQLRKEFISRPEVKRFQEIRAQFERVKQGADANTAAGDLALIFSFMKMLDPASVVREGEFATAQNAAGVPDQVRNWYNKVISGERLNTNQRGMFKTTAQDLFKSEIDVYEGVKAGFKTIVEDAGARPDFVIVGDELTVKSDISGMSDEEILKSLGNIGEIKTTDIKLETDEDIGSFLDSDFKKPDQTGETKDMSSFIKQKEGFREQAYLDPAGVPTIGYGFTSIGGKKVKIGDTITKQQAEQELQNQINRHSSFKNKITASLTPNQETALASFEYNLGPNIWNTDGKQIIELINTGNLQEAANLMKKFNKAKDPKTGKLRELRGLTNRRIEEANLLLNS